MAETIREVLIRVSLKAGDVSLPSIDTSEIKQIQEELGGTTGFLEKEIQAVEKEIAQLNQDLDTLNFEENEGEIEAVTEALTDLEQELADLQSEAREGSGVEEMAADFADLKQVGTDAIDDVRGEVEKLNDEVEKTKEPIEDSQNKLADARARMTEENLKIGESFKAAGEGAFTLARGVAFVSASSEEDFQKMVETIAKVQGAFDIFKGSIETIKGVVEGVRAMRAASAASAAANQALAASNTAVATTGAAAASSMGALTLTLGPIAIAAAAVGAAFFFFRDTSEDVEETTKALEQQRNLLTEIADITRQQAAIQLDFGDLSSEEEDRLITQRLQADLLQVQQESQQKTNQLFKEEVELKKEFNKLLDDETKLTERLVIQDQLDQLAQERQLVAQKSQLDQIQLIAETEQEKLSILQEQEQSLQRQNEKDREGLMLALERLNAEQDRVDSLREGIGALSEEEFIEFKFATQAFQKGGIDALTREQAGLLARAGGQRGAQIEEEFFQQRAEKRGADKILGDLGVDLESDLRDARVVFESMQDALLGEDGLLQERNAAIGDVRESIQSVKDLLNDIAQELIDLRRTSDEIRNGLAAKP